MGGFDPQGLIGFAVILMFSWAISENRATPPWRLIAAGLALQIVLTIALFTIPFVRDAFLLLNGLVRGLQTATEVGTSFVFGFLGGGPLPFEERQPGASFILAFRALPLILVISALSSLLFYWGVLPLIVRGVSWALNRTLGVGGALGVGAAANVFVGMVEAPILIRPYVEKLTRSELFALMTTGMATIAGTVMVLYATILGDALPNALGHILSASVINVPAALVIAGLMVPPAADDEITEGGIDPEQRAKGPMDAITMGTASGVQLVINVGAMLIVLVSLVALVNVALGLFPDLAGEPVTLQRLLGFVLAPFAWMIGIPWSESVTAGGLMGTKLVLNEFIAFLDLSKLVAGELAPRSKLILIYALCGFANLGSLGIMLGGLATIAPERRPEIVALGFKSVLAGFLATSLTGALIGLFAGLVVS